MARKVIWAYAAEEDLESAASYIYRDSPVYAASFVDSALEAGRSLHEFAERGWYGTITKRQQHQRDFCIQLPSRISHRG